MSDLKNMKRVKLGIDPTTADLHLGHVVGLMRAKQFQDEGHKVIIIIGDFTASIGDPSGRDKTRPKLSRNEIHRNASAIREQVLNVLDHKLLEIRENSQWFNELNLYNFLELTSMFTVAQMTERRDFAKRLSEHKPLSMTELLYPILQGYDSYIVDADIEIGGTDQLYNLMMGRELQKYFGKEKPQEIVTVPLLIGLDGEQKMSKSLGNSINLSDTAEEMFFKLMQIPDKLMTQYRDVFIPTVSLVDNPRRNKETLANLITALFHPEQEVIDACGKFYQVVVRKEFVATIEEPAGQTLFEIASRHLSSKNEMRRMLKQNAIKVDGKVVNKDMLLYGCQLEIGKRIKIQINE